ncbi:MAG: PilZ domain-containing protein [Chloroflexi bacterium]|nr:PilZ domain-containing protein [Chloroflexota bacterium]
MAFDERRASQRINVAFEITYECFNPRGEKVDAGSAHTVNISGRGVMVELPRNVDPNARVLVCIKQPFYTLLVMGAVVHSRRVQEGEYQIGMELIEMIEGTWKDWEALAPPLWEPAPE